MDRCMAFLGLLAFAVGVAAVVSNRPPLAETPQPEPQTPAPPPRTAFAFPAAFSLN